MFIVSCPYSVLLPFGFEGGSKTLQDHETSEHASGDECMSTMKRLANHPVVKSIKIKATFTHREMRYYARQVKGSFNICNV